MYIWNQNISNDLNDFFNLETMTLESREESTELKKVLRKKVDEKKYLEKVILDYEKKLSSDQHANNSSVQQRLALAKKNLETINQLLGRESKKIFKSAHESKKKLKETMLQREGLIKDIHDKQQRLQKTFDNEDTANDLKDELSIKNLQLRKLNWSISGFEVEYERSCEEIDKIIPSNMLKMLVDRQYERFIKVIKSRDLTDDNVLVEPARWVSISSYVLQMKVQRKQKRLRFPKDSCISPLWYELSSIFLLLKICSIIMLFDLQELTGVTSAINMVEKILNLIKGHEIPNKVYGSGREDINEVIEFKKQLFDQLEATYIGYIMNGALTLMGKQKSTNPDFLNSITKSVQTFFKRISGNSSWSGLNLELEGVENTCSMAIGFLKRKRELITSYEEDIAVEFDHKPSAFVRGYKSFLHIKSELSKVDVYISANDIFSFVKEIVQLHFQVNQDLPMQGRNTLALAVTLGNNRPKRLFENESDENFSFDKEGKKIQKIKTTGRILSYGGWELWLRNDLYAVIVDGHRESSWYRRQKYSHSYDSMKTEVIKNSFYLADQIRTFLLGGGESIQTSSDDYDKARFVVAKFISEPARNWVIWLANLMLLDLIEKGVITWEEFFDIHPMRGGSDTGNKKIEQINQDVTIITMNWLKAHWPMAENVDPTNECSSEYGMLDPAKASHLEEYYRDEVIIPLLLKRIDSLIKWDHVFSVKEYSEPSMISQVPFRIGSRVLCDARVWRATSYSRSGNAFENFIKEFWKIQDTKRIVEHYNAALDIELKSLTEEDNSELFKFYSAKKLVLLDSMNTLSSDYAARSIAIRKLLEIIQIRLMFIDCFVGICEAQVSPLYPYGPEAHVEALKEVKDQLASDIQETIDRENNDRNQHHTTTGALRESKDPEFETLKAASRKQERGCSSSTTTLQQPSTVEPQDVHFVYLNSSIKKINGKEKCNATSLGSQSLPTQNKDCIDVAETQLIENQKKLLLNSLEELLERKEEISLQHENDQEIWVIRKNGNTIGYIKLVVDTSKILFYHFNANPALQYLFLTEDTKYGPLFDKKIKLAVKA